MDLQCPVCDRRYADRWRCRCGEPLEFAERPLPAATAAADAEIDPREGLWAFADFLPVRRGVTLGEGYTPTVEAAAWDATFKLEYVSPTGSFKDRGAATTISRAIDVGAERVLEDSSGNAGAAIATYAARAGLPAEIYVPAAASERTVRPIRRAGAVVVRVDGLREDVSAACEAAVRDGEGWYASHAWNPAFVAGTATVAFEIAHQRGWSVPDAVVMPIGHGTMFLGAYRGFEALEAAGWIDRVPRLLGVQAAGYAPIAGALHGDGVGDETNAVANGIQIREPVQERAILAAVEETGGDVIALGGEPVAEALDRLHRSGFYVESTSAIAPAALEAYRERGVLDPGDDVLVPLTGSGRNK